jgi:FMN phosphatase YigB (HAD superfamily)
MNTVKCKVPGRNLCAPNGKVSALFVDVDGTIMVCDPYFKAAYQRFCYLLANEGFNADEALKLTKTLYFDYMKVNGVERDQLALAMADAYKKLCQAKNVPVVPEVLGTCEDIGNSPFFRKPELFDNAAPVLNRARHNFLIIGVTMGNREAQKHKIRAAGLDAVFDHYIITPYDNKPERVRELIEDLNISPEYSAFIGNSVKSDGACISETNLVLVPFEKGVFDAEETPKSDKFEVFNVRDWRDAEERSIQRLVMRRDRALQIDEARQQEELMQRGRRRKRRSKKTKSCTSCG